MKVSVKIVRRNLNSVLVEWHQDEDFHRVTIPPEFIDGEGKCHSADLELGIPYGVPFEDFIVIKATPEKIARLLRNRGIWTVEDLMLQHQVVTGVFKTVYGLNYRELIIKLRPYRVREK